jgi:hypothetical protein
MNIRLCQSLVCVLIIMVFLLIPFSFIAHGAPDPNEVEEIKENAKLHVIGEVVVDEVVEDFSNQSRPYQIRVMTLKVSQVRKSPAGMEEVDQLEVYYKYVPAWSAGDFVGGKRMDIAVSDVIEIWLEEGELGWESALWGSTLTHIEYAGKRNNAIPEPFWHAFKRKSNEFFEHNTSLVVIIAFLIILGFVSYRALKNKK